MHQIGVRERGQPTAGRATTVRVEAQGRPQDAQESAPKTRVNVGRTERIASLALGSGLVLNGVMRASPLGALAALAGGALVYRGVSGHCPLYQALGTNSVRSSVRQIAHVPEQAEVERSITIGKPADELYRLWKEPAQIAIIFGEMVRVEQLSETRARWQVKLPVGRPLEWITRLVQDRPGEKVAWRSEDGALVSMEGSIEFRPAPRELGTVVTLHFVFDPPLGMLGDVAAHLLQSVPMLFGEKVLRRFKSLVEAGEIPTLAKNPSARTSSRLFDRVRRHANRGESHASSLLERG